MDCGGRFRANVDWRQAWAAFGQIRVRSTKCGGGLNRHGGFGCPTPPRLDSYRGAVVQPKPPRRFNRTRHALHVRNGRARRLTEAATPGINSRAKNKNSGPIVQIRALSPKSRAGVLQRPPPVVHEQPSHGGRAPKDPETRPMLPALLQRHRLPIGLCVLKRVLDKDARHDVEHRDLSEGLGGDLGATLLGTRRSGPKSPSTSFSGPGFRRKQVSQAPRFARMQVLGPGPADLLGACFLQLSPYSEPRTPGCRDGRPTD